MLTHRSESHSRRIEPCLRLQKSDPAAVGIFYRSIEKLHSTNAVNCRIFAQSKATFFLLQCIIIAYFRQKTKKNREISPNMENYFLYPFTKKRRISSASFLFYCLLISCLRYPLPGNRAELSNPDLQLHHYRICFRPQSILLQQSPQLNTRCFLHQQVQIQ